MQSPRSILLNLISSFDNLAFGCGKNSFVCRQVVEPSHRAFRRSNVNLLARDIIRKVGRGRKGAGPSMTSKLSYMVSPLVVPIGVQ